MVFLTNNIVRYWVHNRNLWEKNGSIINKIYEMVNPRIDSKQWKSHCQGAFPWENRRKVWEDPGHPQNIWRFGAGTIIGSHFLTRESLWRICFFPGF